MLREMLRAIVEIVIVGTPPALMILLGVRFGVNDTLVVVLAFILAMAFAFVVEGRRRKRLLSQRRRQ